MNKYYLYFRYLFRHKFYVARECFKFGLYWRGLKHDWSKFLPCELFPYVESFYGIGTYSDSYEQAYIRYLSREHSYTLPFEKTKAGVKVAFNRAWLHHHLNSHHWQHWILREDSGDTKILEMSINDAKEMYCDWVGAGLAITGKLDIETWYGKNKEKILLHPNTRKFVEQLIYKN
jgi:hypothetical protein